MKKLILVSSIAAAVLTTVSTVQAETIFGLSTSNSLFSFDSASPGTISTPVSITGVTTGTIVDIDFSPVAFTLYGIASNGDLYSLNTTTGAATLRIGVSAQIAPNTITAPTAIDFNPAADRLRVFQGTNSFRLTGDASTYDSAQTAGTVSSDGAFTGIAGANLVAAAYSNNVNNGATAPSLYSLDTTNNTLVLHSTGPAFVTIAPVGTLGVDIGTTNVGFDISFGQGAATGYVSDSDNFYTVNLATGTLSSAAVIGNAGLTTKSIAAASVPEPTTTALAGLALLGLVTRRKRQA
jgi:hypothetical protein